MEQAAPAAPTRLDELLEEFDRWRRIKATDATITMAPLPAVEDFRNRLAREVDAQVAEEAAPSQKAQTLRLELAERLVNSAEPAPERLRGRVDAVRRAQDNGAAAAGGLDRARTVQHRGLSGVLHIWADRRQLAEAGQRVSQAEAELAAAREVLSRAITPDVEVPGDPSPREQLARITSRLADAAVARQPAVDLVASLNAEIDLRHREANALGFDRPLLMVSIYADGPEVVDAPITPRRGELVHVAVAGRLARHRTRSGFLGGSQGVSVPVFKGVRYRVGGFAGQRISEDYVSVVDEGTFVVTNQRIVFVGEAKLVQIPLVKVTHVGVYSDGLEIGREGKESMDIFVLDSPQQVLCFLNYLLQKAQGAG